MSSPSPTMKDADLQRVRELLVGNERRDLESLRDRFTEVETIYKRLQRQLKELEDARDSIDRRIRIVEKGDEFVSKNLPGAVKRRHASEEERAELIETLTPDIEECLEKSVENDRAKMAETLYPAIELILDKRKFSFRQAAADKFALIDPRILYGILSAVLLCGVALFFMGRSGKAKWEQAVGALHNTPGIEVLDAEYSLFGKERVIGLRDPKAEEPLTILSANGFKLSEEDARFVGYLSHGTTFETERKAAETAYFEELGNNIVGAVGDLAGESMNAQQQNLERMTQALFRVRFPEAVKKGAELSIENDQWFLKGTLEEPLFSEVIEELPDLKLTGEVNVEKLLNTTEKRLEQVRAAIGGTTFIFLSGEDDLSEDGLRQAARISDLAKEHEELVERLGVPGAAFEVHALPIQGDAPGNRKLEEFRIDKVGAILQQAGVPADRILPGVNDTEPQEGRVGVYIKVIVDEAEAVTGESG